MGTLLTFLLPAIAPAITDGLRGIIARFTGSAGSQPANMGERVQLMQAETSRLEALAKLDAPVGTPSQWVIDMRASYRYIAIGVIWALAGAAAFTHQDNAVVLILLDMCGASLSFIIGERFYLKMTGK